MDTSWRFVQQKHPHRQPLLNTTLVLWATWTSAQLKGHSLWKTLRPTVCTGVGGMKVKRIRFVSCSCPFLPALSREAPQRMKPRRPVGSWFFLCGMWIHLEICNRVGCGCCLSPNLREFCRLVRGWILSTSCIPPQNRQRVVPDLGSYLTERLSRFHKAMETRAMDCDFNWLTLPFVVSVCLW